MAQSFRSVNLADPGFENRKEIRMNVQASLHGLGLPWHVHILAYSAWGLEDFPHLGGVPNISYLYQCPKGHAFAASISFFLWGSPLA